MEVDMVDELRELVRALVTVELGDRGVDGT
jgi:hypothetical protein